MLSGMSCEASIQIEGVENALLIPAEALNQTSESSYVYTSYDKSTHELGGMVDVTTGLSDGVSVEITSGLNEGDVVYYISQEDIWNSMAEEPHGMLGGLFTEEVPAMEEPMNIDYYE